MFAHILASCTFQHRTGGLSRFAIGAMQLIAVVATILITEDARAHGIAGHRLFPGTVSFDDPAVNDELILSPFSSIKHPTDGTDVTDNAIRWSFMRLLTPTLGIGVDQGFVRRNWGNLTRSGFDTTRLTLKGLLYKNEPHEMLLSAGLSWGIGGSGARGVGAGAAHTVQPGLFFGKGFGDLPEGLAWLRPFGITGSIAADIPTTSTSTILGLDRGTGQLTPMPNQNVETLQWGFSIQYSTYYLTRRFTGGPPKSEPLIQLVPLVEFAFSSAHGQKTVATMSPGVAYAGETYQLAVEAVVPLNSEAGYSVGVRTQIIFFLDDLMPTIFGKPILSR